MTPVEQVAAISDYVLHNIVLTTDSEFFKALAEAELSRRHRPEGDVTIRCAVVWNSKNKRAGVAGSTHDFDGKHVPHKTLIDWANDGIGYEGRCVGFVNVRFTPPETTVEISADEVEE